MSDMKKDNLLLRALILLLCSAGSLMELNAQSSSDFKYYLENNRCDEFISMYQSGYGLSVEDKKSAEDVISLMKMLCGKQRHMKGNAFRTTTNSMGLSFERRPLSKIHTLLTLKVNDDYIFILENLDQNNGYSLRMKGSFSSGNSVNSNEINFGLSCNEYVFITKSKIKYEFTFEIVKSNPFCL